MTFSRLVLVVTGTVFIAYGIAFLAVPVLMAAGAGIALPVPTAVTDVRAVYGGLQLGLGCLLICWSRRPSLTTAGLYAIVATLGGITLGRTLGIVVEQERRDRERDRPRLRGHGPDMRVRGTRVGTNYRPSIRCSLHKGSETRQNLSHEP